MFSKVGPQILTWMRQGNIEDKTFLERHWNVSWITLLLLETYDIVHYPIGNNHISPKILFSWMGEHGLLQFVSDYCMGIMGPRVLYENIAYNIIPASPACICPTSHQVPKVSFEKRRICTLCRHDWLENKICWTMQIYSILLMSNLDDI